MQPNAARSTSGPELAKHLADLGVERGMMMVVHASLVSFGRIDGGCETVFAALRHAVGGEGTIFVPTYTLRLTPDDVYDAATTPSQNVGLLSEHVRAQPGVRRSASPCHSHAGVGPLATLLDATPPTVSTGCGSDFERFRDRGAYLLLLGCDFHRGGTYMHHVEAVQGVPYRAWLSLPRQVRRGDGSVETVLVDYYGRVDRSRLLSLHHLAGALAEAGAIRSAPCRFGWSYFGKLNDIHQAAAGWLRRDPYFLMSTQRGPG